MLADAGLSSDSIECAATPAKSARAPATVGDAGERRRRQQRGKAESSDDQGVPRELQWSEELLEELRRVTGQRREDAPVAAPVIPELGSGVVH